MNDQLNQYQYRGFEIKFLETFKDKYLRNNKSTGSKNIRCFPCCNRIDLLSETTHTHYGFCGDSVNVEITYYRLSKIQSTIICEDIDHKLLFIGEFQPCNEEFNPLKNQIMESTILRHNLDSVSNTKSLHIGEVTNCIQENYRNSQNTSVIITKFTVNLKFFSKPWQYGWVGSRDKSNIKHCFVISVLEPHNSYYSVEAQFRSSSFEVISQRRGVRNTTTTNSSKLLVVDHKSIKNRLKQTVIAKASTDKSNNNYQNIHIDENIFSNSNISELLTSTTLENMIPDILMDFYAADEEQNDCNCTEYLNIISDDSSCDSDDYHSAMQYKLSHC